MLEIEEGHLGGGSVVKNPLISRRHGFILEAEEDPLEQNGNPPSILCLVPHGQRNPGLQPMGSELIQLSNQVANRVAQ